MSSKTIDLTIHFDSDWHVGDGSGQPGYIDRVVRRHPADELPYVPAKSVTGIWRDGCERVAQALDGGQSGNWCRWVEVLFGDQPRERADTQPQAQPLPARLSVREARFDPALRAHLAGSPALREAMTFIKPGVCIDRTTGQARDDYLRFEEVVRSGAVLACTAELAAAEFDDAQRSAAEALLWAGARAAERLGGKRRRGIGRCRFATDTSEAVALKLLSGDPPPVPEPRHHAPPSFADARTEREDGWRKVTLSLELKSPVVVPRATVGNVVECHDHIPGTYLLGPVTGRLRQVGVDPFPWIAAGDIQLRNAYPAPDGRRSRPTPLPFARAKEGGASGEMRTVWNRLAGEVPPKEHPKSLRGGYLVEGEGQAPPRLVEVDLMETTHGTIEDRRQRPTAEVGGVYSYEAIPAGTPLQSELWVREVVAAELDRADPQWWRRLDGALRLGRAKKDDYGAVTLRAEAPEAMAAGEDGDVERFTLWLLSDCLLRDERGRAAADPETLSRAVSAALARHGGSVRLRAVQERDGDGPGGVFVRTARSEGWHVGWGLPRPSYVGLAAGSCIAFVCEQGRAPRRALQALAREGLGERRAEGFGELAVDPGLLTQVTMEWRFDAVPREGASAGATAQLDACSGSGRFARELECAAWRDAIQRAAAACGADADWRRETLGWGASRPPNSQLGTVRSLLGAIRSVDERGIFDAWLRHLKETPSRRDKWPDRALAQLEALVGDEATVWKWLRSNADDAAVPSGFPVITAGGSTALGRELWPEAVRALFGSAMRAEVRSRERGEETNKETVENG